MVSSNSRTQYSFCLHLLKQGIVGCILIAAFCLTALNATVTSFIVGGDSQLETDPNSGNAYVYGSRIDLSNRVIDLINTFGGRSIPDGGTTVTPEGMIVAGDLINHIWYSWGVNEWETWKQIYWGESNNTVIAPGKAVTSLQIPCYETWGNHDGATNATSNYIHNDIAMRSATLRPGVTNISANGLHYSWDWNGVHFVNLGIYAGLGDGPINGGKFAARDSLAFLMDDLATQVGNSGRPVILIHHLPVVSSDSLNWPIADMNAYYDLCLQYNIAAIMNGHSHTDPPEHRYWNGEVPGESPRSTSVPVFGSVDFPETGSYNMFDAGDLSFRTSNHCFIYGEIHNNPGINNDQIIVYAITTTDSWNTFEWRGTDGVSRKDKWVIQVDIPDTGGSDSIAFNASSPPPTTVSPGGIYPVTVDWSASGTRTVEVSLKLSEAPWSAESEFVVMNVSPGQSGTNVFNVIVDNDAIGPCRWRLRLLDTSGQTVIPNEFFGPVSIQNVLAYENLFDGAYNPDFTNDFEGDIGSFDYVGGALRNLGNANTMVFHKDGANWGDYDIMTRMKTNNGPTGNWNNAPMIVFRASGSSYQSISINSSNNKVIYSDNGAWKYASPSNSFTQGDWVYLLISISGQHVKVWASTTGYPDGTGTILVDKTNTNMPLTGSVGFRNSGVATGKWSEVYVDGF